MDKIINYINIFLILVAGIFYGKYNFSDHTFLRDNIQYTYIYITGVVLFISFFSVISNKITVYKLKVFFLVANIAMILGLVFFVSNAAIFNIPIYYIFNINFIQQIIKNDNSPFWLIGFIIIFALIIGLKLLFRSIKKSDIDISTQQIIHYGLLTYLILTPTIWIFTHFTYVSSNFFYMNVHSNIVSNLIEKKVTNNDIKNFKSLEDLKSFYLNSIENEKHKKNKLEGILYTYQTLKKEKIPSKKMGYYDVSNFDEWADFTLNQNHTGYNEKLKQFYFYSIYIPENYDYLFGFFYIKNL